MFIEKDHQVFEFKTKNFIIKYRANDSQDTFDELSEHLDNEEDINAFNKQLENGELIVFDAVVSVYMILDGEEIEIGEDSICQCIYEDAKSFMDHFGLGYYSSVQKLKTSTDTFERNRLKNNIKSFENTGRGNTGSYFNDLVKGAIHNARESEEYIKYIRNAKLIKKISTF